MSEPVTFVRLTVEMSDGTTLTCSSPIDFKVGEERGVEVIRSDKPWVERRLTARTVVRTEGTFDNDDVVWTAKE